MANMFDEMDVLEVLRLMEQGTDDPDDNRILLRSIEEIVNLRAALNRIADYDVDHDLRGRADILSGIAWAALGRHTHTQRGRQCGLPPYVK